MKRYFEILTQTITFDLFLIHVHIYTHTYYKYRNTLINMYNALAVTFIVYQLSVFVGASDLTTTLLINTHTHTHTHMVPGHKKPHLLSAFAQEIIGPALILSRILRRWRSGVPCGDEMFNVEAPKDTLHQDIVHLSFSYVVSPCSVFNKCQLKNFN